MERSGKKGEGGGKKEEGGEGGRDKAGVGQEGEGGEGEGGEIEGEGEGEEDDSLAQSTEDEVGKLLRSTLRDLESALEVYDMLYSVYIIISQQQSATVRFHCTSFMLYSILYISQQQSATVMMECMCWFVTGVT